MSETLPAPFLATSIAAPVATEVSNHAGVNFLAFSANNPHVFKEFFAIAVPISCSLSSSFFEN